MALLTTVNAGATGRELLLWLTYGAVLLAASRAAQRPGAPARLARTAFAAGAAVAALGLAQGGLGAESVLGRPVRYGRVPFGTFFNHNHATTLMVMSFFSGCGLLGARLSRVPEPTEGTRPPIGWAGSAAIVGGLVLLAAGIASSVSRGGRLAMFGAAAAAVFVGIGLKAAPRAAGPRRWALALLLLGAGAAVAFGPLRGRLLRGFEDRSTRERVSLYRTGLRLLADRPAFGWGLGSFMSAYAPYHDWVKVPDHLVDHAHGDWLELAIETGAAGLGFFLGGLAALALRFLARVGALRRDYQWLGLGFFAASLAFFLHAVVDFPLHVPALATTFFTLLCLLGATADRAAPPAALGPALRAMNHLALWAAPALILWSLRPAAAWALLRGAESAPWEIQAVRYQDAFRLDPDPAHLRRGAYAFLRAGESASGAAREDLLRRGLAAARRGLREDPLGHDLRQVNDALLRALGRPGDAQSLIP